MKIGKVDINKEFFLKYKVVLMCILCTIFALLNPLWCGFMWLNFACLGFVIFSFGVEEGYCLYGYLYFYTNLMGNQFFSYVLWGLLFLFILIRHLFMVIRNKETIAKWPMIVSLIFFLFGILPFWNYAYLFGIVVPLGFLAPIYCTYIYRNDLDAYRVLKYMVGGLFVSAFIGVILYHVFNLQMYTIYFPGSFDERAQLYTDNPNFLGFSCIFIIAGLICAIIQKKQNWWTGVLMISITTYLGSLTKSKTFLLTLFILLALTLLVLFFKNKKWGLIISAITLGVVTVLFFIFRDYFEFMKERFFVSGALTIESITTDRWLVWQTFLGKWLETPVNIIFGMGGWSQVFLQVTPYLKCGSHSIYVEFLYYFGLIGIILLVLLIYAYNRDYSKGCSNGVKTYIRTESIFPLIMVFIMGIAEMVIFSQKAFFLPLAILFIFNGSSKVPKERMKIIHNEKFGKKKSVRR